MNVSENKGVTLKYGDLQVISYAEHQLLMSEAIKLLSVTIPESQHTFAEKYLVPETANDPEVLKLAMANIKTQMDNVEEQHNALLLVRCDQDTFYQVITHCALVLSLQLSYDHAAYLLEWTNRNYKCMLLNVLDEATVATKH